MMKLTKAAFFQQFGNQQISTDEIKSNGAMQADKAERLSRADANGDGVIAGQEEMGRLFDWMAFMNRQHNPNQGFGEEIDFEAAPMSLMDAMIQSTGGQPASSTDTSNRTTSNGDFFRPQDTSTTQPQGTGNTTFVQPQGTGTTVTQPQGTGSTTFVQPQGTGTTQPQGTGNTTFVQPQGTGTTTITQPQDTGTTGVGSATGASGINAEKRALLERVVLAAGSANQADVDAVMKEAALLPVSMLQELEAAGMSIRVARNSVTDHMTHLKGVRPRGYPPGATWDNVPGLYSPAHREVVVATDANWDGSRRMSNRHGSTSLLLHEVSHALDHARSYPSNVDQGFVNARERDLPALGAHNSYYVQEGEGGRSETYAETLAMYLNNDPILQRNFPNLYEYWKQEVGG